MGSRTQAHLGRAEHHRNVAQVLITQAAASLTQHPPLDWAAVAAFYAAVHLANAYLWETQRYEPGDHRLRSAAIVRASALRAAAPAYESLRALAYQARYASSFTVPRRAIEATVNTDLEQVRRVVLSALGLRP